MHYNLSKHFFSNRIVAVWNSPPNIVFSAEPTIFKNRLNNFWINQEFQFTLRANSTGIGNHSINSLIICKSVYLFRY